MSPQEMQKRAAAKRQANLTPERRREIARMGARARHAGRTPEQIALEMKRLRNIQTGA